MLQIFFGDVMQTDHHVFACVSAPYLPVVEAKAMLST